MSNKFDKDVQGLALYLEFRKARSTCQVLVTPAGFSATSGVVPPVFFRRVLTAGVTKRKWRGYTMRFGNEGLKNFLQSGDYLTSEVLDTEVERNFKTLEDYFRSLVREGYKLVNDRPVYVEVTKDDLEQTRSNTLPAKLWLRVKSSRTALGFPDTITNEY
jgi:hypothetical protein